MSVVDALGKTCPQPVIMTSKELDALAAAGRQPRRSRYSSTTWSRSRTSNAWRDRASAGSRLRRRSPVPDGASSSPVESRVTRPRGTVRASCDIPLPAVAQVAGKVIAVGSEFMGRGDQELGSILMKGLIYAFANADTPPAKMVFFNGAPASPARARSLSRTSANSRNAVARSSPAARAWTSLASRRSSPWEA